MSCCRKLGTVRQFGQVIECSLVENDDLCRQNTVLASKALTVAQIWQYLDTIHCNYHTQFLFLTFVWRQLRVFSGDSCTFLAHVVYKTTGSQTCASAPEQNITFIIFNMYCCQQLATVLRFGQVTEFHRSKTLFLQAKCKFSFKSADSCANLTVSGQNTL